MRELTFAEAIHEALVEEMRRDPDVFLIGEEIGAHVRPPSVTAGLWGEFGGDRVIDAPISEAIIAGSAVGAAFAGMRPIVDLLVADFMVDAMDVIVHQAAKGRYVSDGEAKVPMVVRASFGHGREDMANFEAWFVHVPGLKVVMPSTPYDAKGLLKSAIRDDNPVMFFEHGSFGRGLSGPVPEEEYTVPLGVGDIKREGSDVTIVATARMVHEALAAAEELTQEAIGLEVVDLRSLYPIDKTIVLDSVNKTGRLVVVHQAWKTGGVGAEISAIVAEEAFSSLKAPIARVAALDVPVPFNPALQAIALPSKDDIVNAVRNVLST